MLRCASPRERARPAPCALEWSDAAEPRPSTWKVGAPIEPGTMPASPSAAGIAPFRWIQSDSPLTVSRLTCLIVDAGDPRRRQRRGAEVLRDDVARRRDHRR